MHCCLDSKRPPPGWGWPDLHSELWEIGGYQDDAAVGSEEIAFFDDVGLEPELRTMKRQSQSTILSSASRMNPPQPWDRSTS